jgi:UPF0755 protein
MKKTLLLFAALLVAWALWAFVLARGADQSTVVSIGVGQGASSISRTLKNAGVIHSALAFRLATRLSGQQGQLKAGDYEIPPGLSVLQTLDLLVSGKTLVHPFLVREGLSGKQIAAFLEKEGLGKAPAFMAAMADPELVADLGIPGPTVEGYLFPDTYQIPKGMNERALVKMMVARFKKRVPADLLAQGAAIRLTPAQIITMASIIEKEAKADKERPVVSAVFRNRMKQKKRLESCATVRFAFNKWTGPLYNKDLLKPSPYNTYQVFGLPPGPICSPGLASINAAIHPVQTDAMYFVVAGDGTHIFSKTFEEHQKAVARWKKLKKGIVDN